MKTIWLIKGLTLIPLVFSVLLIADYFLSSQERQEEIVAMEKYRPRRASSSGEETPVLRTVHYSLSVTPEDYYAINEKEAVKLVVTPIFRQVKYIIYKGNTVDGYYLTRPMHSVFNAFLLMPFILLGSCFVTLFSSRQKELVYGLGIITLVAWAIVLYSCGFF
jgi:hypothetical protein